MTAVSCSERRRAVVTSNKDKNTTIEIYHADRRAFVVDCSAFHGDIHTSGPFAGLSWSPNETKLVYVAEATTAVQPPLYGVATDESIGQEYEYKEHFGELCEKYRNPEIFVLTVDTGDVERVGTCSNSSSSSSNLSAQEFPKTHQYPGRPVWLPPSTTEPERESVVITVWEAFHKRRLGMIYYSSRRSHLVRVEIDGRSSKKTYIVTPMTSLHTDQSACDPRFSPDGTKMMYLTSVTTDLHGATMRVRLLTCSSGDWYSSGGSSATEGEGEEKGTQQGEEESNTAVQRMQPTTVVDVPRGKDILASFYGLYARPGQTTERVWLSNSRHIVLTSQCQSSSVLMFIDTLHCTCRPIHTPPTVATRGSHRASHAKVLDVHGNKVLWSLSAAHKSSAVFTLTFDDLDGDTFSSMTWGRVSLPSNSIDRMLSVHMKSLQTIVLEVDVVPSQAAEEEDTDALPVKAQPFECVLILPGSENEGSPSPSSPSAPSAPSSTDASPISNTASDALPSLLPPLILYPHGGPHSASFTGYSPEIATLTMFGFAVCHVNYRGSLGFGQDALESLPGNCGINDVSDCVQALQKVLDSGLVNTEQVYILGGSHGKRRVWWWLIDFHFIVDVFFFLPFFFLLKILVL